MDLFGFEVLKWAKLNVDHQFCFVLCSAQSIDSVPRSNDVFKEYVSGKFGERMIAGYIEKLREFPNLALQTQSLAQDFFILVLLQIGDTWRRFCNNLSCFPYVLWQLCDLTDAELYQKFAELRDIATKCPSCIDVEFSTPLLQHVPQPFDATNAEHQQRLLQVQRFLQDSATHFPISTDQVETMHGFMQAKVGRARGLRPTDETGKEIALWSTITASYKHVRDWIWARAGDPQAGKRLAMLNNNRGRHEGLQPKLSFADLREMAKMPDTCKFKRKRLCGFLPNKGVRR